MRRGRSQGLMPALAGRLRRRTATRRFVAVRRCGESRPLRRQDVSPRLGIVTQRRAAKLSYLREIESPALIDEDRSREPLERARRDLREGLVRFAAAIVGFFLAPVPLAAVVVRFAAARERDRFGGAGKPAYVVLGGLGRSILCANANDCRSLTECSIERRLQRSLQADGIVGRRRNPPAQNRGRPGSSRARNRVPERLQQRTLGRRRSLRGSAARRRAAASRTDALARCVGSSANSGAFAGATMTRASSTPSMPRRPASISPAKPARACASTTACGVSMPMLASASPLLER